MVMTAMADEAGQRRRGASRAPSDAPTVSSWRYVSGGGQRAGAQHQGEVVGLLDREAALDDAARPEIRCVDDRGRGTLPSSTIASARPMLAPVYVLELLRAVRVEEKCTAGWLYWSCERRALRRSRPVTRGPS